MNKLYKILILLVFFGLGIQCASAAHTISFNPQTVQMDIGSSQKVQIVMDKVPNGLSGFNITISIDPKIAEITEFSFPSWSTLPRNSTFPSSSVWVQCFDGDLKVNSSDTNVLLGNITLTGKKAGTADLNISADSYYDRDGGGSNGNHICPNAIPSKINVLDTVLPVIASVSLNNSTPNTGNPILVTVNTTDNVGVSSVKANDISLVHSGNAWSGIITAIEGTHLVNVSAKDAAGNTAWNNSTFYTAITPDTTSPVIASVSVNNSTPNTDDSILVTVDTTDNIGVNEVKANDILLSNQDGSIWSGIITAIEGTHTVNVSSVDGAGNVAWNNYTSYTTTIPDTKSPVILPTSNFSTNVSEGYAPLTVQFNDSSENATGWNWDFGDGQISTVQNPSHTYNTPGIYTVSLNASNADGYNISTKSNLITVNSTTPPVTNGLVVYYDGRLSGNSLVDLSGNNNIGYATSVISGTNQLTDANYINMNGVNSKIDVSNNAQTNISSPVSIEFIGSIYEFDLYRALVSKYDDRNITGWYTGCSAHPPYQQVRFALCGWNETNGTNYMYGDKSVDWLVAGQVYHIVVTYDNITARIYINGVNSGNHTWNSPILGNSKNITIGSGSGIPNGNCNMYAFRLYNRTLSSDEVLQNYKSDLWRYKVTPKIFWSKPADITYGTALNSTQLNANASVPGNFTYNPAAGTILSAGNQTLQVTFTPNDTANYTNATANVTINISENPEPVLPVANFTASVISGSVPLSVQFNDSSENATSWSWNFGDGYISTVQNPSHTYNTPGTYSVSLNASNADGYNLSVKSNLITVNSTAPPITNGLVTNGLIVYYDGNSSGNSLTDLSGNNNMGYATNVTSGTNQATGANYINLNGVNSKIDVSNNAQTNISGPISIEFIGSIHEFKKYGALVSKYDNGVTGWYLSCSSGTPYDHARFGAGLQNGFIGYNSDSILDADKVYDIVATYDNSNAKIYINGTLSSIRTWNSPIVGNPKNITIGYGSGIPYCNCSMYTFRLYNRALSSDEVLQNYKSDLWRFNRVPTPPVADFSANSTSGYAPLTVQFTDTSTNNPTSWSWEFGDGQTSDVQNPEHTFSGESVYNVTLVAINGDGSSSVKSMNITVNRSPTPPVANFTVNKTEGTIPLTVKFTDASTNSPTSWSWEFGDGQTSDIQNPEHTFSTEGVYKVNLTATNGDGSSNKKSKDITVNRVLTPPIADDVDKPEIQSVLLFPANTTAGSKIYVSANIRDNTGVAKVIAGDAQLMSIGGSWQGNITAPLSPGKYSLSIEANDATGNTVDSSVPYSVVQRQGGVKVEVMPTVSKVVAGKSTIVTVKVKNTQNIDDTFKVRINVNGISAFYRAGTPKFSWIEKTVNLRAKQEVLIPIEVKVSARRVSGLKLVRAKVNSEKFSVQGSDIGYLVISHPRYVYK